MIFPALIGAHFAHASRQKRIEGLSHGRHAASHRQLQHRSTLRRAGRRRLDVGGGCLLLLSVCRRSIAEPRAAVAWIKPGSSPRLPACATPTPRPCLSTAASTESRCLRATNCAICVWCVCREEARRSRASRCSPPASYAMAGRCALPTPTWPRTGARKAWRRSAGDRARAGAQSGSRRQSESVFSRR